MLNDLLFFTSDRNNVEQPPHGLWADVTEPVLSHQQLGQVEGHLPGDGPLHLPSPVCVLNSMSVQRKTETRISIRSDFYVFEFIMFPAGLARLICSHRCKTNTATGDV